jgi:iron complex outermembrane receptor protein
LRNPISAFNNRKGNGWLFFASEIKFNMKSRFTLIKTFGILCLMLIGIDLFAQNTTLKGTIFTKDGKPAANVNVILKEIKRETISADDGSYHLHNLKGGDYTLIISCVGLQTLQRVIHCEGNQVCEMDFILHENENELTEVIVTGSKGLNEKPVTVGKVLINPMDLPQSTTVIGKNILERQQTLRLSDALMNVNGVYVYGTTGGAQEEIGGRGYAFNSSNTFKNGARYNNGTMPEMSGLERVEIMKGSAAILFGNVAAGGVLNLVTKKPRFDRGGEISFRVGSYDLYKPAIDLYGPISKSIAYRVNTTFEKSNSFRDQVHAERYYVNPSFLFKLGKKTELFVEGDYLQDERTSDFGIAAVDYVIADIPRNRFLGASWSYYNTKQSTITTTTTHQLNKNWKLSNILSYQGSNIELFGTTRPNASGQMVKSNGDWIRGLQRTGNKEKYYLVQLDLTGRFNTGNLKHTLLVGADADQYKTNANAYNYANPALGNKNIYDSINVFDLNKFVQRSDVPDMTATTLTHTPINRVGVYAQDLVELVEKVKLLAGIRFSYQESGGGYVYNYQAKTETKTDKTSDRAFSPRLGLVYQPTKNISLFTSYSNSFALNTGTDVNLNPLAPSYIDQYEAGVKTELFKKILSANITVYQIVNSNLAQMSLTDAAGNPNNNANIKELAGQVTSKGIELDLMSKPIYGFSFIGGYSYNQTKYTESNTFVVGSMLRYNPQHTANASIYYNFSERSFLKGFNAGLLGYYVGERVAGRSTRVQVPNDAFKLMPIPDYFQFDASLGYNIQKFSVRLKLSNLFNQLSYYVHDDNSINPIAPRQFSMTAAVKL